MPTKQEALEALNRLTTPLSMEELIAADFRLVCAYIESAGKDAEWKPIETAPKDGTQILAATKDGRLAMTHYLPQHGGFYAGGDQFGPYVWTRVGISALCAWRQLPQPPAIDAAITAAKESK